MPEVAPDVDRVPRPGVGGAWVSRRGVRLPLTMPDENALAVCAALEGRGALDAPIHQRGSPGRATIHPPTTGGP